MKNDSRPPPAAFFDAKIIDLTERKNYDRRSKTTSSKCY